MPPWRRRRMIFVLRPRMQYVRIRQELYVTYFENHV